MTDKTHPAGDSRPDGESTGDPSRVPDPRPDPGNSDPAPDRGSLPDHASDEALFDDYRKGNLASLRVLMVRYQEPLMRFLYRLMGDRQGAEDAFQEAFLQVHLSADSFDIGRRFKPWLFTIAANKGRDLLRKKNRRQEVDLLAPIRPNGSGANGDHAGGVFVDLMEIDIPRPMDRALDEERDAMVQRAIQSIPLSLREILLLAYFQKLSYQQIADDLSIPLGTVKSRLHSAVAAFAKAWQAQVKKQQD